MRYLKKITPLVARNLAIGFYLVGITTHLLVILKIIPYDWINGGRAESFEAQAGQSAFSAIILILLMVAVWIRTKPESGPSKSKRAVFIFLAVLWTLGFLTQLAGTDFERYVMSITLLIGVVSHLRLALAQSVKL